MKFQVTAGPKRGLAFEVKEGELRIGRRRENDVVLDDQSVSGKHARLYMEDGEVIIEDCDSVNGIEVNGKPVKKSILQEGDKITIGMTEIMVSEPDEASPGMEKPPEKKNLKIKKEEEKEEKDEPGEEEEIPRFKSREKSSKKDRASGKKKKSPVTIILAVLLMLAVIGTAVFLPQLKKKIAASQRDNSENARAGNERINAFFKLRYEKVQASAKNIFRYELRIESETLTIVIDDLKQDRHVKRNKTLEPNALARLQGVIQDQQFFSLPSQIEGKSQDMWDSSIIDAATGGQIHRVQVLNRLPPDNFKKICNILEDFGEKELNMTGFSMSSEELRKRAQDSFQRGRNLFEQRLVKPDNLFNAIKAFDEAIWYLDTIEPKPAIYNEAIQGRQEAGARLKEQTDDHKFRARRAMELKEWKTAAMELRQLLEKLPDASNKDYQDAQVQLLDTERHLRPK
ncbi:MAG: FHA domain-containing protein [Verrucomicrobiae bacterium]|nr:FHA domain-containing protein [Verrucomicrobiae bacterium]